MTRLASILILLAAFSASSQLAPPQPEWSWRSALVWQVPNQPAQTVTFTLPTKLTIQTSTDLQTWTDYAPAVVTFTATNNGGQQFFRLSREVQFKITEIVSLPNYLPGNAWMTNYNVPAGYYIALLDEHGLVTRILRNAKTITLADNEVAGHLVRQWQDKNGNEL